MPVQSPDSRLTELLRRSDPLGDDRGLGPAQSAEMRRAVLAQIPEESSGLWPQLSPALSIAALLVLALGVAWLPSAKDDFQPRTVPAGETTLTLNSSSAETPNPGGTNALENRNIQFETPGGTLVVWVLNPNFPS